MSDTAAYEALSSPEAYDLFVRGARFLRDGHPGAAALLLERAAQLAPGRNSIREALGRSYYALGRHDRAAEVFAAIAADVPTNDYAQFGLGCALLRLGCPEEACGRLRLAVAMDPARPEYIRRLRKAEQLCAPPDAAT